VRVLVILFILLSTQFYFFTDTFHGIEKGILNTHSQDDASNSASSRLALVIGNSKYSVGPLKNPVNDARAISSVLKTLGFGVMLKENLSQIQMRKAIDEYGQKLARQKGVGLFYYSGHGLQVNGENYIIPIGSNIRHERQVEYEAVKVGRVLAEMENAGNPLNIVILDACRDNPFARSFRTGKQGLASIDAPIGTIISYSTAPGKTAADGSGANSPYTEELVKWMKEPGLRIEDVFMKTRVGVRRKASNQIPWESTSLEGIFYFNPASTRVASSPSQDTHATTTDPGSIAIGSESGLGKAKATFFAYNLYKHAYADFAEGSYGDSRKKFEEFFSLYPNSSKASTAKYLIAESYYREGKFEDALLAYQKFIDAYPKDNRLPLSYLKQGLALIEMGFNKEARLFLQTVIDKYRQSEEAKTAKEKIRELPITR